MPKFFKYLALIALMGCASYDRPRSNIGRTAYGISVAEKPVEKIGEVVLPDSEASELSYGSGSHIGKKSSSGSRLDSKKEIISLVEEVELPAEEISDNSPLAVVDEILANLDLGNLAFNAPDLMGVGETYQIELLLSPTESLSDLKSALMGDGPTGTAEGIHIAPEMEATLIGSGFEIKAVTPSRQAVGRDQRTRWVWEVSPESKGSHNLHLTLSARIIVEGKDTPYVVKTFSKTIKVEVSLWGSFVTFFDRYWQWLSTTLVFPLIMWLWKRKKKKT